MPRREPCPDRGGRVPVRLFGLPAQLPAVCRRAASTRIRRPKIICPSKSRTTAAWSSTANSAPRSKSSALPRSKARGIRSATSPIRPKLRAAQAALNLSFPVRWRKQRSLLLRRNWIRRSHPPRSAIPAALSRTSAIFPSPITATFMFRIMNISGVPRSARASCSSFCSHTLRSVSRSAWASLP